MGAAAVDVATAFAFLIVLAGATRWGSGVIGRLVDGGDDELLVVCFLGLVLLSAGVAHELGVSDAIGAFMMGLILGATTAKERIVRLVHPLRDAFGALFFFAFGVAIDPGDVLSVAGPVVLAVMLSVGLNVAAGIVAARLSGLGSGGAANIGLTVLARGEFALVLASLAAAAGLDARLAPFVAGYVLVLAVLGPLAATRSETLARLLPRGLVAPVRAPARVGVGHP